MKYYDLKPRDGGVAPTPAEPKQGEDWVRAECIAYNNWVQSLHKTGFPINTDGSIMDCWQLFDYYSKLIKEEGGLIRDSYVNHAKKYSHL